MVRKEKQTLELDALEPSCKVGSQENFTANLMANLNTACSDAVALDPTLEEGTSSPHVLMTMLLLIYLKWKTMFFQGITVDRANTPASARRSLQRNL
jgi:hypothetical protein